MRTRLPEVGMCKGDLFFNKRYIKGVPTLPKLVRGWNSGRSLSVLNFVKYPLHPFKPTCQGRLLENRSTPIPDWKLTEVLFSLVKEEQKNSKSKVNGEIGLKKMLID